MEDIKVIEGNVGIEDANPYLSPGELRKREALRWARSLGKAKENNLKCYLCGIPSGARRDGRGTSLRKVKQGYICQWCYGNKV